MTRSINFTSIDTNTVELAARNIFRVLDATSWNKIDKAEDFHIFADEPLAYDPKTNQLLTVCAEKYEDDVVLALHALQLNSKNLVEDCETYESYVITCPLDNQYAYVADLLRYNNIEVISR